MVGAGPSPDRGGDAALLREEVERLVAQGPGRGGGVATLGRRRFPVVGSYDCYALTVGLESGAVLRLFLKDFGFSRQSKDAPGERRDRELRVYRELLSGSELGTAHYHGSVWDPGRGRFWLLLELVEGVPVEEANLEDGVHAARWLARLHAHFACQRERLASCDFLTRHDAGFFRAKGERALEDVGALCPGAARRLEAVLDRYDPAVRSMVAGPRTLVHGGYIPWHILLDARPRPSRVCAIDWELAALGSTLYDLAFFSDEAEPAVRDGLCEAYRAEASRLGLAVPDQASLCEGVACFRLHRVLDWLSRSREKGFAAEKVARLVDLAVRRSRATPR